MRLGGNSFDYFPEFLTSVSNKNFDWQSGPQGLNLSNPLSPLPVWFRGMWSSTDANRDSD